MEIVPKIIHVAASRSTSNGQLGDFVSFQPDAHVRVSVVKREERKYTENTTFDFANIRLTGGASSILASTSRGTCVAVVYEFGEAEDVFVYGVLDR